MERSESSNRSGCPSSDISAYIDGELDQHAELELEMHIAGCRVCAENLNLQKSFLNALDSSMDEQQKIELPKDFARSVVTNAESRVSGLRRPHERRNAAFICTALAAFSLLTLGNNAEKTFAATAAVVEKVFAIVTSIGHLVYDVSLGLAIIFRSLASNFLFDSGISGVLFLSLFIVSLYIFSRLMGRFRRT
jgi:anti-sigma factor RsiW